MRNHLAVCAQQSQVRVTRAFRLSAWVLASAFFPGVWSLGAGVPRATPALAQEERVQLPRSPSEKPRAKHVWLSAGLAQYEEWRELRQNQPDAARRMVEEAFQSAQRQGDSREHAVARGFMAWRTLETVIDRERVDKALREYYRRHRGARAALADFRKICEEISGRGLGWFFDYYLQGTQLPEISLRRTAGGAPNEVTGEIVVHNAPVEFQVRVELRVFTAAGVINHSVATSGPVTPFTVVTREPATRITVDPDLRILRRREPSVF
jgi:hypothetical protein